MRKRFHAQAAAVLPLVIAALAGSSLTASPELNGHVGRAPSASRIARHKAQLIIKRSHIGKPAISGSAGNPKQNASAGASGFNFTPEQRKDYGEMMRLQNASDENVKLGDADAELKNWSRSATYYQEALDIWPQNTEALYGLGRCAAATGDLAHAISYYHTAVYVPSPNTLNTYGTVPGDGFQTNDIEHLMQFAVLLNKAGQTAEALTVYNHAAYILDYRDSQFTGGKPFLKVMLPELAFVPASPDQVQYTAARLQALANTALAYEEKGFGSGKEATAHMREAVKLYPESPVTQYYLGEALLGPRYSTESKAAFQKAIDLGDEKTGAAAKERMKMLR